MKNFNTSLQINTTENTTAAMLEYFDLYTFPEGLSVFSFKITHEKPDVDNISATNYYLRHFDDVPGLADIKQLLLSNFESVPDILSKA